MKGTRPGLVEAQDENAARRDPRGDLLYGTCRVWRVVDDASRNHEGIASARQRKLKEIRAQEVQILDGLAAAEGFSKL